MKPNTLSIAVASGRIGYVYLADGEVRDWGISVVAARSPEAAQAKTNFLIRNYRPDLIVTEKLSPHSRKSGRTIQNVRIIEDVARSADAQHIAVEHIQHYANKYLEMEALAERYPVLKPWQPRPRKLWESEDRKTVIWEALALVDQVEI